MKLNKLLTNLTVLEVMTYISIYNLNKLYISKTINSFKIWYNEYVSDIKYKKM